MAGMTPGMRCEFPTGAGTGCANPPGRNGRCAAGHPSRATLTAALQSQGIDAAALAAAADPFAFEVQPPRVANTEDNRRKGTYWRDEDLLDSPEGFRDRFRHLADGKYRMFDTGFNAITIHQRLSNGTHRHIGYLSWFGGKPPLDDAGNPIDRKGNINNGMIHKVVVSSPQRRKGLATAMLAFARDRYPDSQVRHSGALSDDGRAWASATG